MKLNNEIQDIIEHFDLRHLTSTPKYSFYLSKNRGIQLVTKNEIISTDSTYIIDYSLNMNYIPNSTDTHLKMNHVNLITIVQNLTTLRKDIRNAQSNDNYFTLIGLRERETQLESYFQSTSNRIKKLQLEKVKEYEEK